MYFYIEKLFLGGRYGAPFWCTYYANEIKSETQNIKCKYKIVGEEKEEKQKRKEETQRKQEVKRSIDSFGFPPSSPLWFKREREREGSVYCSKNPAFVDTSLQICIRSYLFLERLLPRIGWEAFSWEARMNEKASVSKELNARHKKVSPCSRFILSKASIRY